MNDATTFIQENQTALIAVGAALVVLLLAWLTARAVRHHRQKSSQPEDPGPRIRRPLYVDTALLDELKAHAPAPAPHGGEVGGHQVTTTLGSSTPPPSPTEDRDGRGLATRKLNDTHDALVGSPVLTDVDADPDADLVAGRAVLLTGKLQRHPATDAAEILELAAPLLVRNQRNATDPEGGATAPSAVRAPERDRVAAEADASAAPLVVTIEHPVTKRGLLMVLRRDHLVVEDPVAVGGEVTVLAVVDRVLGRRETADPEDYLAPHLSPAGRDALAERDLADTIATLSEVADEDLGAKDLRLKGPAAVLTVASIHR